jgi:phage-related protein
VSTINDTYKLDSKADTKGIKEGQSALAGLGKTLGGIAKIGAAPFKAIGGAIAGIGKATAVFGLAMQGLQKLQGILGGVFDSLKASSPNFAIQMERIQGVLGSLQDKIMTGIGPVIEKFAGMLARILENPGVQKLIDFIVNILVGALDQAMGVIEQFLPVIESLIGAFADLLGGGDMADFAESMEEAFGPGVGALITGIVGTVKALFDLLGNGDMEQFGETLANAVGPEAAGVITGVIQFFIDNVPKAIAFIGEIGKVAGEVFGAIGQVISGFIADNGPAISGFFEGAFKTIGEILGNIWEIIKTIFGAIAKFINENQEGIQTAISVVWTAISTGVETALKVISGVINAVLSVLKGDWEGAWAAMNKVFVDIWNGLGTVVSTAWNAIKGAVQTGINAVINGINNGLIYSINNAILWANNNIPGANWKTLDTIPFVSLAQGGIVSSPIPAIVGDNPNSPEVVAPLEELLGMMQKALADVGGGVTVNVYGPFGAGYTPEAAGQAAARGALAELRAQGRRA